MISKATKPNDSDCPVCPKKIEYSKEEFEYDFSRYLAIVKEKDRADKPEYTRRLALCTECEYLSNGLCTQCGCFAEIRCILKTARCPAPKARW